MDDPAAVRRVNRVGDGDRPGRRRVPRNWSTPQTFCERLTVDVFHDDERDVLLVADVMDRADIRMAELRDGPRLTLAARAPRGVVHHAGRQHLDRDVAVQPRIVRPVDLAHPAGAEQAHDFVGTKSRAGTNRHGSGWNRSEQPKAGAAYAQCPLDLHANDACT